jgi:hypothetical protein
MDRMEMLEGRIVNLELRPLILTPEHLDKIAEAAADKALEKVYARVGKQVMTKLAWILGVVVLSAMVWLSGKDALLK